MEGTADPGVHDQSQHKQHVNAQDTLNAVERLNPAVQQQLNLESVKNRAISLFKAISRILEGFDVLARTSSAPKWQDVLGQFSMVNLELFNIVEDIKKVSKAFVVHPKNINAQNSMILPVMLSTKLLPEMEMEDNTKREQLLHGMQTLPLSNQIDKLKARIEMIGAACESAEKVLAETRKAYCFGGRQGPTIVVMDKVQASKIQEQENLLRAAVNTGEGLHISGDHQKQIPVSLPMHLIDVLPAGDGMQVSSDSSGMYLRNTPPLPSTHVNVQGTLLQASGMQLVGRTGTSPAATTSTPFESTAASPVTYANSPRSVSTLTNVPSPQQQAHRQQPQQLQLQQQMQQQQQRQKMLQLPQQPQMLAQQQFRQTSLQAFEQALHGHMQFSQPLGHQQFQPRQISSGHVAQGQLNPGNQMSRQLGQLSGNTNSTLLGAQATQNSQMIPNIQAAMTPQTLMPRMQYGMPSATMQRSHGPQIVGDSIFNVNPGVAIPMQQQQQQQQQQQHGFGNLTQQSLQPQNLPTFQQQRQHNQP